MTDPDRNRLSRLTDRAVAVLADTLRLAAERRTPAVTLEILCDALRAADPGGAGRVLDVDVTTILERRTSTAPDGSGASVTGPSHVPFGASALDGDVRAVLAIAIEFAAAANTRLDTIGLARALAGFALGTMTVPVAPMTEVPDQSQASAAGEPAVDDPLLAALQDRLALLEIDTPESA
jgi:hypothetical protein